ncbi:MAG: VWA domain-containing protein, partial [Cyclobacteriaceae bacterium]|nr:VWA domain-containing protein [Cyclobacteriaceae bacterium]
YNKIAYQGNKFPIVAEITNTGFQNQEAMVNVKKGSNTIASEKITFGSENGLSRVEFNIDATNNGVQHYSIEVTLPEEEIIENNSKQIFIDVIDGKQKILLLGLAPHPDIKALRSVIEINENYEFELFIPGFNELKEDKYDLIMVHQAGDRYNRLAQYTKKFRDENVPILNIIGQQTNLDNLSKEDNLFSFKSIRNQRDQISPALFSEFSKFKVDSEFMDIFNQYPTLNVPYGENNLAPNATVLIYQKVGNIATNKPLLYLVESGETKSAYLMADGIWQWRLQEFASKESTKAFDDVFLKLVQYLSTKEDKRKFRVYTTKEEFFDNETVSFEAEVYNDSYERIFGNDVSIKVTDENGATEEYSFIPSSANSKLEISGLTQGVYKYEATTKRNDQPERVLGQFTVKNLLLELLDRRANFSLLRQLAENAEGQFYTMQRLNEISSDLKELNSKGIMQSNEEFLAIINLKWLFFLILILLSIEWFTRKYSGAY